MRKSARVTLVLIGLSTLAGCGEDESRRDVYRTREDCLADWGNQPKDCTPATESRHSGFWYGPIYGYGPGGSGSAWTQRNATGPSRSIGSTSGVTRGGFGSTGISSSG